MAKAVATEWKPLVMRKSKARLIERIFITNGLQRIGYIDSMEEAEAECTKRNSFNRHHAEANRTAI